MAIGIMELIIVAFIALPLLIGLAVVIYFVATGRKFQTQTGPSCWACEAPLWATNNSCPHCGAKARCQPAPKPNQ